MSPRHFVASLRVLIFYLRDVQTTPRPEHSNFSFSGVSAVSLLAGSLSEIERYNSLQDPMEFTLSHRQRVNYGLSGNPRM